jgi:hypothetical protein
MKRLRIAIVLFCLIAPLFAQSHGGLTVQVQSAGTPIGTFNTWLPINCSTNLTCTFSGGVVTMTASATGATAWSGITAATNSNAGTFTASGNTWDFHSATLKLISPTTNGDLAGWNGSGQPTDSGILGTSVPTSVVNDTNVTGSISSNALTLGWTGTLAKNRIISSAVFKDQSNAWTTGTQDWSGVTHSLPVVTGAIGSIPATCAVGELYFSTSATAGQNLYYCTATNTFTQQSSGGGSGTVTSVAVSAPLAGGPITTTGTISITGAAGQVLAGATPAFTATPTLGASGTLGSLTFGNATSGTLTLEPVTGAISGTVKIPTGSDTLVNLTGTQTMSGKTLTSPNITTINDGNGNPFLLSSATASAVDSVTVTNAATANPATVQIAGTGSDSNINLELLPKGTGKLELGSTNSTVDGSGNGVFVGVTGTGVVNFGGATHTQPALKGGAASIPATCTQGEEYFATDATAGQNMYYCTSTNTWTQQLNSGAGGANTALSNLSAVAVNASLTPGADASIDLGSLGLRWRNQFLSGSIQWTNGSGTADTGLSRGSAGVVDVGNGTAGDITGSIIAAGLATGSATVPAFNGMTFPAITAPSTPASGTQNVWVDSTDNRLHDEGSAGTVGTTVVANAGGSHEWLASVGTSGVFTATRPALSDLTATISSPLSVSTNTLSCPTCATTTSGGALSATSPVTISSGGLIAISGVSGEQGNGANLQLSTGTVNTNRITKFDSNGNTVNSALLESSSAISDVTSTQAVTYGGGANASANSALGAAILQGANETGAGGASSQGGGALVEGGTNAATNAASQGGGVELLAGASTGATQGLQGLVLWGDVYVTASTSTQWDLACFSAAMTTKNCGASPSSWVGVIETVGSNYNVVVSPPSLVPINASGAVTLGHTVCAGGTAGQITDSAGTATCTSAQGATVGVVAAVAGAWTLPDGTTFTASTTLPLIKMNTAVLGTAPGGSFPLVVSGTVVSGGIPYFSSTTQESSSALLAAHALVVGGGAGTAPATGNGDFTYVTHTLTGGASGLVDFSAITSTAGLKVPVAAGNTATAAGTIDFDSTNNNYHGYVNGADSLFLNSAAALTTNVLPKAVIASGNMLVANSTITDNGTTVTTSEPLFTSYGGTASQASLYATGAPYTAGSATTNFPLVYINDGTGPTTLSTAGTEFGINSPNGFAGNLIDAHINGGGQIFGVDYLGEGYFGAFGAALTNGSSGGWAATEGTAFTGTSTQYGEYNDSTLHCVDIIDQTVNLGCAVGEASIIGANVIPKASGTTSKIAASSITDNVLVTSSEFVNFASNRVFMTADWTCGTGGTVSSCTSATIVGSTGTPLTLTLPLSAQSWHFHCHVIVTDTTATPANNWAMITATNGATNVTASYSGFTAAAVAAGGSTTDTASTTSSITIGGTWTQGATATKMPYDIDAWIEGASASGTVVSLQVIDPTVGDLLTIYRGAYCTVGPF